VLFDPGRIRQAEWTVSGMGHPIPGTVGSRMRIRIFHPQPLGCCRRVEFGIRRDQHQRLVPGMHVQRHRQLHGVVGPAARGGQFGGQFGVRGQFGVSRLCRLAAPGMMKMELGFGSQPFEGGYMSTRC